MKTPAQTWTADDAVRITGRFAEWLTTPDAHRVTRRSLTTVAPREEDLDLDAASSVADALLAEALRGDPVMWCDPAMVDLVAASAGALPAAAAEQPLLLPPSGLAVFAKDLPAEWVVNHRGTGTLAVEHDLVRAISWVCFTEPVHYTLITPWKAGSPTLSRLDGQLIRVRELHPGHAIQVIDPDAPRHGTFPGLDPLYVLQALAELSRHQITREDSRPASKASRRAAQASGTVDPAVRRLYLQRPEDGPEELEALRAARAGIVRAHWVRGHWRKQPYPSIGEHRWRWIEGYPRGEGPLAGRTSASVLLARGRVGASG